MSTRTRVTVVLRELDHDPDFGDEKHYLSEWVHADDGSYSYDDDGCRLDWHDGNESYFPWTSVLRVDWSRCDCWECTRKAREAA
jgi:hypothetical protein